MYSKVDIVTWRAPWREGELKASDVNMSTTSRHLQEQKPLWSGPWLQENKTDDLLRMKTERVIVNQITA